MIIWDNANTPNTLNETGEENLYRTRAWVCYLFGMPFMFLLMLVGSIAYVHFFDYPPAPAPGQGMNAAEAIVTAQRAQVKGERGN